MDHCFSHIHRTCHVYSLALELAIRTLLLCSDSLLPLRNWHLCVNSRCCTTHLATNGTFPGHRPHQQCASATRAGGSTAPAKEERDGGHHGPGPKTGSPTDESELKRFLIRGCTCVLQNPYNSGDAVGHSIIITSLWLKRITLINIFF